MLKAATGERVATGQGWVDGLDGGGRSGVLAVLVAVLLALLAVVLAYVVIQGAIDSVSQSFPKDSTRPLPSVSAQR